MGFVRCFNIAAALFFSSAAFGQGEIQFRVGRQPGWNLQAREGRCEMRVWVDHHAEMRLRGDGISVQTLEGARSYDEGSTCSQPLPYYAVRDLQLRQIAGRNAVKLVQQPGRMNNYTAVFAINDDQGGGDHYSFEVRWGLEGDRPDAPAPFFDDVRACQDTVRQRFLSRNGHDSYIDFDGSAARENPGAGRELLRGRGTARSRSESRDIAYSCIVDSRGGQVRSGDYQYSAPGMRANNSNTLK
jgi:hypothetical protein